MPSLRLTDRALRSLTTEESREDIHDASFPAFLVRVSGNGSKTFYFRYRGADGKYRRLHLGKFPAVSLADARSAARELELQVDRGEDPGLRNEEWRKAPTVAMAVDEYIERYAKRHQRSWRNTQRVLHKDIVPVIGHRKLADIKRRDISLLVEGIVGRGAPQSANQALGMMRHLFRWAAREELLEIDPCFGVQQPAPYTTRDRNLSPAEIRLVWSALDEELPVLSGGLRLMLLLGQRGNEVRRMRWADLNGDLWTIPAEHSKSGRAHLVPLSESAREEIESHRGRSQTWVLPSPDGDFPVSRTTSSRLTQRVASAHGMARWTAHDLRRTVASQLAEMGVEEFVIQRILGHAYSTVTATYNRYSYLAEKRAALEKWGQRLMEIVGAEGAEAAR
ncbi:MAG TPA: tyrosine-type recombinase/integrase [Thermoanaerobaculia bacterium]|nr:tyrosine-type recombinase/integrase [Thermoanaerobaculia bacterium]